jgi:hypothetical protein
VLGVVSNCTQDEALAAFAKRSRRVKSDETSPFEIEDLTTALAEIQQSGRAGAVSLQYKIPCNPSAYKPGSHFTSNGISISCQSPAESLIGSEVADGEKSQAAAVLLAASINSILDWKWTDAADLARECLRLSTDEDERDEALNVLAASLTMVGEPQKALQALQKAVEGRWNLNLQANLGIIATSQDPGLAAVQMSYLINGASTAQEKLRAARLGINLWRESQGDELDDDELEPLPGELLEAVYSLLKMPDLAEEDFYDLGSFLAKVETGNATLTVTIGTSPHRSSPSARIINSLQNDLLTQLTTLSRVAAEDIRHERPWIQSSLDTYVRIINGKLIDKESFASNLAFEMLDNGLDASNFSRISLRFLLVQSLPDLLEAKATPSEKFLKWHAEAKKEIFSRDLPEDQIDILRELGNQAGNILGALTHFSLIDTCVKVENAANSVLQRMNGLLNRLTANKDAVRELSRNITGACREIISDYDKVLPHVTDPDIRKDMSELRSHMATILNRIDSFT